MTLEEFLDQGLALLTRTVGATCLPAMLPARYEGQPDRIAFSLPYQPGEHDARWRMCVRVLNG